MISLRFNNIDTSIAMKPSFDLPIIFENERYVIVNKPAGLIVHADGKTIEPTIVDWVINRYPLTKDVGEPLVLSNGDIVARPGIVHRIDRDTSGALVIALTQEAFLHLKEQFQCREVGKIYHAFVYGSVKKDEDTIDRPIGRSRKDFRLWSAQRLAKGQLRDAVTDIKVLERGRGSVGTPKPGDEVTLLEVHPRTGRTHQIRVHCKAINHPVICDRLYAPKRDSLLGFKRLALHAYSVEFKDVDGSTITAPAPYPEDFEKALVLLAKV